MSDLAGSCSLATYVLGRLPLLALRWRSSINSCGRSCWSKPAAPIQSRGCHRQTGPRLIGRRSPGHARLKPGLLIPPARSPWTLCAPARKSVRPLARLMSHHARLQAATGWAAGRLGDRLAVLAGRPALDQSLAGEIGREPRLRVKAIWHKGDEADSPVRLHREL